MFSKRLYILHNTIRISFFFFLLACSIINDGIITTPNYPDNYPNNANCVWKITVPAGFCVQLTFNSFQLENDRPWCNYDSVQVKNGPTNQSPLIGKFCGSIKPPVVTSSGRSMYMNFTSDETLTYKGFRARYVAVAITTTPPTTAPRTQPSGTI